MKAIIYHCSCLVLPKNAYKSALVDGTWCYFFSSNPAHKNDQIDTLKRFITPSQSTNKKIFFLPDDEKLKYLASELLTFTNDGNTLSPKDYKDYDDTDLGGKEQANCIRTEMEKLVDKNASENNIQITFINTFEQRRESQGTYKKMAVVYNFNNSTLSSESRSSEDTFEVNNVGSCYWFSNSILEEETKNRIEKLYHERNDTVFLIPEGLKNFFLDLFRKVGGTFTEEPYKDGDLNEKTDLVKSEIIKRCGAGDFSQDQIVFNTTIRSTDMPTKEELAKEFKELLTTVVKDSVGVSAVFVYDLRSNFQLHRSTSADSGTEGLLGGGAMASFGKLKTVKPTVDKFTKEGNGGEFRYAIFQLEKGILQVYFETFGNNELAIGFVSSAADEMGSLLFYSGRHIGGIRDKLRQLF